MRICMPAKTLFGEHGLGPHQVCDVGDQPRHEPGLALRRGQDHVVDEAVPNMAGCSCNRPSASQMRPSPIWMVRARTRTGVRCAHRTHPWPSRMIGASSARVRSAWNWWVAASDGSTHTWIMK